MSLFKNIAAYQLVRLLSSKFENWPAFKNGIIDDNGDTIRKPKTDTEKKSFTMFHRLVRRIKQIMKKAPFGAFKIASLAIALKLLKEETGHDLTSELENFGINNQLISEYTNYTTSESISQGRYEDSGGNIFIIKEDIHPIDNIINTNIYQVYEIVSRKSIYITKETIKKV